VGDLDNLLAGADGFKNFNTQGFFTHTVDEFFGGLKMYICFQKGYANFPKRFFYVLFGYMALTT